MADKFMGDNIPRFTRPADIASDKIHVASVHSASVVCRGRKRKLADSLFDENNRLRLAFFDKLISKLLKLLRIYP